MSDKRIPLREGTILGVVWLLSLALLSGVLFSGFYEGYIALKVTYLIVLPRLWRLLLCIFANWSWKNEFHY